MTPFHWVGEWLEQKCGEKYKREGGLVVLGKNVYLKIQFHTEIVIFIIWITILQSCILRLTTNVKKYNRTTDFFPISESVQIPNTLKSNISTPTQNI